VSSAAGLQFIDYAMLGLRAASQPSTDNSPESGQSDDRSNFNI
jgi:hypothetical protein